VSELKHESALREVSVSAVTVNDDDDLDALLGGGGLKEKEIAEIANMLLDNLDDVDAFAVDAFADDWILDNTNLNVNMSISLSRKLLVLVAIAIGKSQSSLPNLKNCKVKLLSCNLPPQSQMIEI